MDNDVHEEVEKTSSAKWILLAAAAAGLTAAGIFMARRRLAPTMQISRLLDRCESAAGQLDHRIAA